MNKAYGIILKYYRKKAGLSQFELCEGICVPSYLSKIENSEIAPSDSILEDFTKKLGIQLEEKDSLASQELCLEIIDLIFNLRLDEACQLYPKLQMDLSFTDIAHEYLALKYYFEEDPVIEEVLKNSLIHLGNERASRIALLIYDKKREDEELLNKYYSFSGYGYYLKGNAYYGSQSYSRALSCFEEAEKYFLREGLLNGMFHAIKHQGVINSLANRLDRALVIFQRLYKMANEAGSKQFAVIHRTTYYNIHYIKYLLNEPNHLKELLINYLAEKKYTNSVIFHVLSDLYKKEDPEKAKAVLLEGMENFKDKESWHYQLLKMDLMLIENPDFQGSDAYYYELKKQIKFLYQEKNFLTYHMRVKELIEYLKAKRRYKEAIEIIEQMKLIEL